MIENAILVNQVVPAVVVQKDVLNARIILKIHWIFVLPVKWDIIRMMSKRLVKNAIKNV
jgi:hypothetical protein